MRSLTPLALLALLLLPATGFAQLRMGRSPARSAPVRSAPVRSAPVRSAPVRSAPVRSAPVRSAPVRSAPRRSSPVRSAPRRSAPVRSAPRRSTSTYRRSTPRTSRRTPGTTYRTAPSRSTYRTTPARTTRRSSPTPGSSFNTNRSRSTSSTIGGNYGSRNSYRNRSGSTRTAPTPGTSSSRIRTWHIGGNRGSSVRRTVPRVPSTNRSSRSWRSTSPTRGSVTNRYSRTTSPRPITVSRRKSSPLPGRGSLGLYAPDRSSRAGRRTGGGLKSSSGSKRSGASTSSSLLDSTTRGRRIGSSVTPRLRPVGPVIGTRPGRRPGSGYGGGSRYGGGYGNGYGLGGGHGYPPRWGYYYPSYAWCYPWHRYRPWCGYTWSYYSWPRYCYTWPWYGVYYGASYPVYSSTIYVYSDAYLDSDGIIEAGEYDPVGATIPVEGGDSTSRPAEDGPDSEDLTLARHYSSLGNLYMRTRRYSRALDSYQRAVKLAPEDGSLRFVLADALFQLGKLDECAYQIRKGLILDPSLATVDVDKRSFFDWPEDFDIALVKLEKKVAEEPFRANLRLVLAYNFRMTKRYAEARRELTTLSEQLPGDETITLMLDGLTTMAKSKDKSGEKTR